MRLWHKDLIPVLPMQQLLGQWRECCCIARNINVNGTPNHLLVNKIIDYPAEHFQTYAWLIFEELNRRGYYAKYALFSRWYPVKDQPVSAVDYAELFYGWHNWKYLRQCYYNLEEKHDCGGINDEEFEKIKAVFEDALRITTRAI